MNDLLGYKIKEKATGEFWWIIGMDINSVTIIKTGREIIVFLTELLVKYELITEAKKEKVECFMINDRAFGKVPMRKRLVEIENEPTSN